MVTGMAMIANRAVTIRPWTTRGSATMPRVIVQTDEPHGLGSDRSKSVNDRTSDAISGPTVKSRNPMIHGATKTSPRHGLAP